MDLQNQKNCEGKKKTKKERKKKKKERFINPVG
jgi:hypothetical protein